MPYYAKLVIAILLAVGASEIDATITNAILILLLLGLVLTHYQTFARLISQAAITK